MLYEKIFRVYNYFPPVIFRRGTRMPNIFINKEGKMVFGRNYDWVSGSGMVNTNLRGLAKTSFPMQEGKTISWVSKYGSMTFNQYGKNFQPAA